MLDLYALKPQAWSIIKIHINRVIREFNEKIRI